MTGRGMKRRAVVTGRGVELVLDRIYVALARIAADPTDFYHLPLRQQQRL